MGAGQGRHEVLRSLLITESCVAGLRVREIPLPELPLRPFPLSGPGIQSSVYVPRLSNVIAGAEMTQ